MRWLVTLLAFTLVHAANARPVRVKLEHGGRERTAWLYTPEGNGPWPLVMALHGGGGKGKNMEKLTSFGALGRSAGFAVCYPDGVGKSWNDGRNDFLTASAAADVDDVGFLAALIEELVNEGVADAKRIHVCGISNGGMMTLRLACERPNLLAAVGVVAASEPETYRCDSGTPVPIFFIHGSEDPLIPFSGGAIKLFRNGRERGRVISVPASVADWQVRDHAPAAVESDLPVLDQSDPTRAHLYDHGPMLRYIEIQGGGHTWPGGWAYAPAFLVGRTCHNLNASRCLWEFFREHARP